MLNEVKHLDEMHRASLRYAEILPYGQNDSATRCRALRYAEILPYGQNDSATRCWALHGYAAHISSSKKRSTR